MKGGPVNEDGIGSPLALSLGSDFGLVLSLVHFL
jgi:hypothetical protein